MSWTIIQFTKTVWEKSAICFANIYAIKTPSIGLFGDVLAHDITYFLKNIESIRDRLDILNLIIS